jgi:hypothetical protein
MLRQRIGKIADEIPEFASLAQGKSLKAET